MKDYNHAKIPAHQEPQSNQPLMYPCQHCNNSFTTQRGLSKHIAWNHPGVIKKPHQCRVCKEVFPYPFQVKRHLEQVHTKDRPYKCPKCTFHCQLEWNLKIHLKIHDKNRETFKCSKCGKEYVTKPGLRKHSRTAHDSHGDEENTMSVNIQNIVDKECTGNVEGDQSEASCGIAETTSEYMTIAVTQGVQNEMGTSEHLPTGCKPGLVANAVPSAGRECYYAPIPVEKKPQRNQPPLYPCQHCNKTFTTQQGLSLHIKLIHLEVFKTPFECHICSKEFPYLSELKKHVLQAHSKEKPFNCPRCSFHCKSQLSLNQHLITHEENRKRFKCSICGKDYATKPALNFHWKTKHCRLNNEVDAHSNNSQRNSTAYCNEEEGQHETNGRIVEAAPEKIPTTVSQDVQNGLPTYDHHPLAGAGCTGSETKGKKLVFVMWKCNCGNLYALEDDARRHCHHDHKPHGSTSETLTGNVSEELDQNVPSGQIGFNKIDTNRSKTVH